MKFKIATARNILIAALLPIAFGACNRSESGKSDVQDADSIYSYSNILLHSIGNVDVAMGRVDTALQRNIMQPVEGDVLRSLINFNNSKVRIAQYYARKAYKEPTLKKYPKSYLQALTVLTDDCLRNSDYAKCVEYAHQGYEEALKNHEDVQAVRFLYYIAQAQYRTGTKENAYKYFDKTLKLATSVADKVGTWQAAEQLSFNYINVVLGMQSSDAKRALNYIEGLDSAYNRLASFDNADKTVLDHREAETEYAKALVYVNIGQQAKAEECMSRFMQSDFSKTSTGKSYLSEYLFTSKQYEKALPYLSEMEFNSRDTLNEAYFKIIVKEMVANYNLGNKARAADFAMRVKEINDSLDDRNRAERAIELNKAYDTAEKEQLIQSKQNELRVMQVVFAGVFIVIILLVVLILRMRRYNEIITQKNRSASETLSQLLRYKNELYKEKQELEKVIEKNEEEENEVEEKVEPLKSEDDEDKEIYDRMVNAIISERLFLKPALKREEVITKCNVPRAKFASLFATYAGTSFNKYINNLRLEYAVQLIQYHPDFTIETIGNMCGMPIGQTFYRNFQDKFGVTPTEFRNSLVEESDDKESEQE